MTVYKLIVNLDATLSVQNANGSFNYFKPSIGAEMTTDETDDLTILNNKFENLYEQVIGPNFKAVVEEFLINSDEEKDEDKKDCNCSEKDCDCSNNNCECDDKSCSYKQLEVDTDDNLTDTPIEDLLKEEWE